MQFYFKKFIFLILASLLLSCNNDDDIDPKNTADLSIALEASNNTPTVGTRLELTVTATNNGPLDATAVLVKNKILSGYTFDSFETSSGEYDSETGIWTIGNLNNQETVTLTLAVTVNPTGNYNTTASISGGQRDLSETNNSTSIVFTPTALTADMLFTYTLSEGNDKFVTITGLSDVWENLGGTYKSDITVPSEIQGHLVTVIGNEAFEDNEDLVNIVLPNTIKTINSRAFNDCTGLKNINIPNSVTYIGIHSFSDCISLSSLIIPNSVISIGSSAFTYCSGLTNVTISDGVKSIGSGAFAYCTALKTIVVPNSVTEIDTRAFYDCSTLTQITLPENLTIIESEILSGCTILATVTLPGTVTKIGTNAFRNCQSLTDIMIPSNVTLIGAGAFVDCSALVFFNVEKSNATFSSVDGVMYDKKGEKLLYYPNGKSGSFTIPNSVTEIDQLSFAYSKKLTGVTIPNSVITIKSNAFRYCTGLTSITIPSSVTSIGLYAFSDNPNLKSVTLNPSLPPSINTSLLPFANCDNLTGAGAIKVPASSLDAYKTTNGWLSYKNIIDMQ